MDVRNMSSSDLYRLYRTKAVHYAEMRNGWGTAPVVWRHLSNRFLGKEMSPLMDDPELWKLARDTRVPLPFRLVHAFCCDQAMCPIDRLTELADACLIVWQATDNGKMVNHWATVANFLRGHQRKPKQVGVALSCTSVSDPWISWKQGLSQEPWDIFEYCSQSSGEGK